MASNRETSYVFLAHFGAPYNLVVSGDIANISGNGETVSGYGRPNPMGDPRNPCTVNGSTIPVGSQGCFFNLAAFAAPVASFGNFRCFANQLTNIPFGEL
jgi:hypothetical protein